MGDSQNVKAMFRRAQAEFSLKNYMDCMSDIKKVLELDNQNKEARALYKQAQAGQKEEDKISKGLFSKMCAGLGKGPIPAPYKDKSLAMDGDEDDDEDMGEDAPMGEDAEKTS